MRKKKSIEFGALRIFVSVAESETLTVAGQRLGITQSAVSQAIKQLEEQTESRLIVRRSRPIKLTPSGELFKTYADKVLSQTSQIMNDLKLASAGKLNKLTIGMIDSFGDMLALQLLTSIKRFVSKVTVQTGLHTSLSEALQNRDIDFLITSDPMIEDSSYLSLALIRDPFLVIAPQQYLPDNKQDHEQIIHLAKTLPFIHYLPSSRIGLQTDLIARRIGVEFNTHYELDSTQSLVRFVQANQGWAIISALCLVRYHDLLEGIKVINLDGGANARFISQLSRKNEFGELPNTLASLTRELYTKEVTPLLSAIAPWLPEQAYAIDKLPSI